MKMLNRYQGCDTLIPCEVKLLEIMYKMFMPYKTLEPRRVDGSYKT